MSLCQNYNPDGVFKSFKILVFPTTFVGLTSTLSQDIQYDLKKSVYLRTRCDKQLMSISEAIAISANHRAFEISSTDDSQSLLITFKPTYECIARMRRSNHSKIVMMDLSVMRACGDARCCLDERHLELARYYLCGQYEFPNLIFTPNALNFGTLLLASTERRVLDLTNNSYVLAAKIHFCKNAGLWVNPPKCIIQPNSTATLTVVARPMTFNFPRSIQFRMLNPHFDIVEDKNKEDVGNFLELKINIISNIKHNKPKKVVPIESLHKLNDKLPQFAFTESEMILNQIKKEKSKLFLEFAKATAKRKKVSNRKLCKVPDLCLSITEETCNANNEHTIPDELPDFIISPFEIDFKHVVVNTVKREKLKIENQSLCEISLHFLQCDHIRYANESNFYAKITVAPKSQKELYIFCKINTLGFHTGHIEYKMNKRYYYRHPFKILIENSNLYIKDTILKFGMVNNECYIMSAPVRIFNIYNVDLSFQWVDIDPDTPFSVIPKNGYVPSDTFRSCDVIYTGTASKTKTHIIKLEACGNMIEVELIIYTRKVLISFLERSLSFKQVPLYLTTTVNVVIENASKELATYCVVEPLLPGLTVLPMHGNIRPKALISIVLTLKLSCIIEFSSDVNFKINNKEIVVLPINGDVLEPKIVIQPKILNTPRVPCGMITYVPIVIHNQGMLKSLIQITNDSDTLETKICSDICDLEIYIARGSEMEKDNDIFIEGGQSKILYLKVFDTERRAYDFFLPIKINKLIGPPDSNNRGSMDLQIFIRDNEKLYSNNPKIRVKAMNREICCCKVNGLFSKRCLLFSKEKFEIDYQPNTSNSLSFSITNISKNIVPITIVTSKLEPYFKLEIESDDIKYAFSHEFLTFKLDSEKAINMIVFFHPTKIGKYVVTADLYLDKALSVPYHNLKFVGRYVNPEMTVSSSLICFAPVSLGSDVKKNFTISSENKVEKSNLLYKLDPVSNALKIIYLDFKDKPQTEQIIEVEICISSDKEECNESTLTIYTTENEQKIECKLLLSYCFTNCPLTLHASYIISPEDNPFPFYPIEDNSTFSKYMNASVHFLERWMYQQGFRRELFPEIPDTFHVISKSLGGRTEGSSTNVSFLTFLRRIAGTSAVRNINNKNSSIDFDSDEEILQGIHDVYTEIIDMILKHGGLLGIIKAEYLLRYEEFCFFAKLQCCEVGLRKSFDNNLMENEEKFKRLNKQSWFDLILQCYKVFILDCCFECSVNENSHVNNSQTLLMQWLQNHVDTEYTHLFPCEMDQFFEDCCETRNITNFTSDLQDGVILAAATVHFCPYMNINLCGLCKVRSNNETLDIIHNALLNIECWNQMRLNFPIESKDFIESNYLQMLFLSVHLYVTLPTLNPRENLIFQPPLLGSSSRNIILTTGVHETVVFTHMLLNNQRNYFTVEKNRNDEIAKKATVMNVKYTANFLRQHTSVLLFNCYNKTRMFDTYIVFTLVGEIGSIVPLIKFKLNCPLYRSNKMDVMICSPFKTDCSFHMMLTNEEPTIPVQFHEEESAKFLACRVNLLYKDVLLLGTQDDVGNEDTLYRVILSIFCTSSRTKNTWIWFRGEVGEFCIKVTTLPRTDATLDTLYAKIGSWPLNQCSCGEECECYRTGILTVPFRNHQMLNTLRSALLENASMIMMDTYDKLRETAMGRCIIEMLFEEDGTDMLEVSHIFTDEVKYKVSSKGMHMTEETVIIPHQEDGEHTFVATIPMSDEVPDKFVLTLTSDCGLDVRTYRVLFYQDEHMAV